MPACPGAHGLSILRRCNALLLKRTTKMARPKMFKIFPDILPLSSIGLQLTKTTNARPVVFRTSIFKCLKLDSNKQYSSVLCKLKSHFHFAMYGGVKCVGGEISKLYIRETVYLKGPCCSHFFLKSGKGSNMVITVPSSKNSDAPGGCLLSGAQK